MTINLYAELVAQTGKAVTPSGRKADAVLETPDFRRIRDLKRYVWQDDPELEELVERLSAICRTETQPPIGDPLCEKHHCPGGPQTLRPVQAVALRCVYELGGAFMPIQVGGGKTLVSLLIAFVLNLDNYFDRTAPKQIERPMLIVPAGLREKTRNDAYHLARHWRIPPIGITSYELLSRDYGAEDNEAATWLQKSGRILGGLRPDLIIADEGQKLKNTRAACTKKVSRYLRGSRKENKRVRFVDMSGSASEHSMRDYWHLIRWALGNGAPVPHDVEEMMLWCAALDEGVDAESRVQPGALPRLSPDLAEVKCYGQGCGERYLITLDRCPACGKDKDEIVIARSAFRDRLHSAPGVVSTQEDRPSMSLTITGVDLKAPDNIREAIKGMRATWCTPDGHPFEQAVQLWQHARELQCGFYYVWDPRPPHEWMALRRDWHKYVRETLAHSRTYDSPQHLIRAIVAGKVDDGGLYAEWKAIEPTFVPNSVANWIDDTTLLYAKDWLGKRSNRLCWVEHQDFGERLSAISGIPFFREKGCDPAGNLVDNHKGPAIVSIHSCRAGRNLQYSWSQNLYVSPSSVADHWEQSLGRTHRYGQTEDEVTAEALMMVSEAYSSLVYAIRKAEAIEQRDGAPQKLVYGTRDLGAIEKLIERRSDEMWKSEVGV